MSMAYSKRRVSAHNLRIDELDVCCGPPQIPKHC